MSASQNNLGIVLNQQDSSGINIINRSLSFSYDGVCGEFDKRTLAADTSSHAFDLPTTIVLHFFFKNTHATAVVTLTGTVQGGSSQVLKKVQPGGTFMVWDVSTSATAGYTALSYQSDTASATAEMFIGG